jgi:hypothetical protein
LPLGLCRNSHTVDTGIALEIGGLLDGLTITA